MRIIFSVLILFSLFSFTSFAQKSNNELITMQRGACFGSCPQYKITIYTNGNVVFEGERNVDKFGKYSKKISKSEVNKLIKNFRKAKFFSFKNEYETKHTDFPETIISFRDKGETKTISHFNEAPEILVLLEKQIDKIANSTGWNKISEADN